MTTICTDRIKVKDQVKNLTIKREGGVWAQYFSHEIKEMMHEAKITAEAHHAPYFAPQNFAVAVALVGP